MSPCHPREAEGLSKRREFGDGSRDWSDARAMSWGTEATSGSWGTQAVSKTWQGREMDFAIIACRKQLCQNLDFSPVKVVPDFCPQNYKIVVLCCFKPLSFVGICYSRNRKHIQVNTIFMPNCWALLFSHSVVFNSLWPHGLQHAWFPCPLLSPGVCSNSSPLNQWCHSTILFSVTPFSFCLQSFPASGSFTMSRLFISGGQSIGASASVLPMNIQSWFPLGLTTGLISLWSNGL